MAARSASGDRWLRACLAATGLAGLLAFASAGLLLTEPDLTWPLIGAAAFGGCAALLAFNPLAGRRLRRTALLAAPPDPAEIRAIEERLGAAETRLADFERRRAGDRAGANKLTAQVALVGSAIKIVAERLAEHQEQLDRLVAGVAPTVPSDAPPLSSPIPLAPDPGGAPAALPSLPVAAPTDAPAIVPALAVLSATPVEPTHPPPAAESEAARVAAIVKALAQDRIEVHLRPVVTLPDRRLKLHDAVSRLRIDADGIVAATEFLAVAERRGLAAIVDERMLGRAAKIARYLAARGDAAVICKLSASSAVEPRFWRSLLRLFESEADIAARLVIELPQRVLRALEAERRALLGAAATRGVRLSIDRLEDLRLDPTMLADRGVRFVKIPAALLIGAETGATADSPPAGLPAMLARSGIEIIATGVDSETMIAALAEANVALAQGAAIGPPRLVRAEVHGEGAAREKAGAVETPPRKALVAERKPFAALRWRASA